ncbi:MAG: hypothetical protein NTV52_35530, partial [Acidobacteria bacterium]|nr:hypothetical protein [Acidobacteriota bacterium]
GLCAGQGLRASLGRVLRRTGMGRWFAGRVAAAAEAVGELCGGQGLVVGGSVSLRRVLRRTGMGSWSAGRNVASAEAAGSGCAGRGLVAGRRVGVSPVAR